MSHHEPNSVSDAFLSRQEQNAPRKRPPERAGADGVEEETAKGGGGPETAFFCGTPSPNWCAKQRRMEVTAQTTGAGLFLCVFTHISSALHWGHLSPSRPAFSGPNPQACLVKVISPAPISPSISRLNVDETDRVYVSIICK